MPREGEQRMTESSRYRYEIGIRVIVAADALDECRRKLATLIEGQEGVVAVRTPITTAQRPAGGTDAAESRFIRTAQEDLERAGWLARADEDGADVTLDEIDSRLAYMRSKGASDPAIARLERHRQVIDELEGEGE
jgi:hypothetical protein